jgi:starch phosphorylase
VSGRRISSSDPDAAEESEAMDGTGVVVGIDRRGLDKDALKRSILEKLAYAIGKDPSHATDRDWYASVALAVRDRLVDSWLASTRGYYERDQKRVYYLSLEFLIGRLLVSNLDNLGIDAATREALAELGVAPERVFEAEPDAALGNGGLGRLAACFLDSMATIGVAGYGYGIRYEYGLFKQELDHGWQAETPEDWLRFGNPWEFERPEVCYPIDFYGRVETEAGSDGSLRHVWRSEQRVIAMAYDTPVAGFGGRTVNTLRLWAAKAARGLDLDHFHRGDYQSAVGERVLSKTLSRVLYPNDMMPAGQELRLKQEYFFTSASLQDSLRRFLRFHDNLQSLPDHVALQLNDTHPAIAVPELMRLLIDQHGLAWEQAWAITRGCIAYTNHTLMPEALERWPVGLLERVLPRHMQLIYEINARFLSEVRRRSAGAPPLGEVSLIDESNGRAVRMGHLAFVGSHKVNGVSALHTELMRRTVFAGLHAQFPERIVNQTNGISPRRWLHQCNPELSRLVTETIGEGWVTDLERIEALAPLADDPAFRDAFALAKQASKRRLAARIAETAGIEVAPDALFDVHVKRVHEYKRQLLNILEAVALYEAILRAPDAGWPPRVKIFAGKAAASYHRAKLIIKLINDVAARVNHDPAVRGLLKIVFLPNYNVTLAERIMPAADLSEQISTAGMEASGTGNMKLALNGALTIGTLDGANIEIRERVGAENIFIFGLHAEEVVALRADSGHDPRAAVARDPRLARVLDLIASGAFSPDEPQRFRPLLDDLLTRDHFMVTADFDAYWQAQRAVDRAWGDRQDWLKRAVLNTAKVGWFSSDRTIRAYAREIWHALPDDQRIDDLHRRTG